MEWREQSTVSCELAYAEARRWVEVVTGKRFGSSNFRSALENGVLLCDLINKLKPGIIRRVNRLSTPIAGLDNVNVFLRACGKLGLNHSQLFHPGDLQDISNRVTVRHEETSRRLKNVLITLYWLGRRAQADPAYHGPQLNFKAFEGLLGVALSKVLEESSCSKSGVRDGGYGEAQEERLDRGRGESVQNLDTLRAQSDYTHIMATEGFGSDAEAERCFGMSEGGGIETGPAASRDGRAVPTPLRRKRAERHKVASREPATHLPRAPVRWSPLGGSKSMSDIALEPVCQESDSNVAFDPSGSWQDYQDQAEGVLPLAAGGVAPATRAKDGEARWQDDLDRWKSRRRSVTSDLHRKNEERLVGVGGSESRSPTLEGGLHEESEREGVLVIARQEQCQGVSSSTVPPSQPPVPRRAPRLGSLASDDAFAPSESSPLTLSCNTPGFMSTMPENEASTHASHPENGACSLTNDTAGRDGPIDPALTEQTEGATAVFLSPPGASDPAETSQTDRRHPVAVPRAKSLEDTPSGRAYISASLPRGFRRSEGGSRLSTGVTPRPFRAKSSKVASLPRFYSADESHSGLAKSQRERPRLPVSFISPERVVTPASEGHAPSAVPRASQTRKKREEEEGGQVRDSAPKVHSFVTASVVATGPRPTPSPRFLDRSSKDEVGYSDMRVSLHQKPSSGRDFGFQADWDSSGARIRSVQPGSPAQLCHLQAGDEITCVGGRHVAEMSYEQWKACMDAALREGKLLMDLRRHGQNGWSNTASSLPFKSHKTIDLTSMDPALVAGPERCVMDASGPVLPVEDKGEERDRRPANGLSVNAQNGSFSDGPLTTGNQGGSESAISDLQVPSIGTSASSWSWDTEEERKRQEKWQMEQERLLQEKYRRDQERLEEEWRKAQEAAASPEGGGPEQRISLSNGNTTPHTPPPLFSQSDSSVFAALGQHGAEVGPLQIRQVTKQPAAGRPPMEECDSSTEISQWKKSKSTPSLDCSYKQDTRVAGKKKGRPSQAEQDRLQILEEMRKKTPLHTDSSWIRTQGTCSVSKEPVSMAPITRHNSPEKLPPSNSAHRLPHNASTRCSLGSATPYRGYSTRRSLGPDAAIFSNSLRQRSASASPTQPIVPGAEDTPPGSLQRSRLVSGRRTCSRCGRPLAKGVALIIDSLDLCFHAGCFKCVSCKCDLSGDPEAEAQVRVRRRQLYCDGCYGRLRVRHSLPK